MSAQKHSENLRRTLSNNTDTPNILTLYKQIEEINYYEPDVTECLGTFQSLLHNDDAVLTVIRQLHAKMLVDGSHATCRAMAIFIKSSPSRFRVHWMSLLQENFEKREEMITVKNVFRNAVQFHGYVYNTVLSVHGNRTYICLAASLITYMEMLLTSPYIDDLSILLLQLLNNREKLELDEYAAYNGFLVNIRKAALKNKSVGLLLAIDISCGVFPHPEESPIREFYYTSLNDLYSELECQYLGKAYTAANRPELSPAPFMDPLHSSTRLEGSSAGNPEESNELSNNEKIKQAIGMVYDPQLVRERMRSKGLLKKSSGHFVRHGKENGVLVDLSKESRK